MTSEISQCFCLNYLQCAKLLDFKNHNRWKFKTISRNKVYIKDHELNIDTEIIEYKVQVNNTIIRI